MRSGIARAAAKEAKPRCSRTFLAARSFSFREASLMTNFARFALSIGVAAPIAGNSTNFLDSWF
jgi:hypothetical protein